MPNLIGRSPNQVPVNGMLGTAAFVDIGQLPSLNLIATGTINGVSTLNITNIPTYKRLTVIVDNVTFASNDQIQIKLSVDNGSTFPGSVYVGSPVAITPTILPVYFEILGADISFRKRVIATPQSGTAIVLFNETNAAINAAPINAIRIYSTTNNFVGGTYYIYGEN